MPLRLVRIAIVAAAVLVALGILIHTPPFRALVLRYAIRTVQDRYGIQIAASRLDYNLATLHLALADIRVSASGDPQPFFAAARVDVTLTRSVLVGDVAFREIAAIGAQITVLRQADGRTNLPRSSGEDAEPAALRVARVFAPSAKVDVRDQQANVALGIPDLTIDVRASGGRIALGAPARLAYGGTTTEVSRLAGDASFDGRDLHLSQVQMAATEGTSRLDGVVRLLRREPGVDLQVTSTIDLRQAARWGMDVRQAPAGTVALAGRVSGPFSGLSANITAESESMTWSTLQASDVRARLALTPDRLTLDDATLRTAGGRVAIQASMRFDRSRQTEIHASWSGIDADALMARLSSAATLRPAGVTSGMVDARGAGDLRGWTADGRLHVDPSTNGRGRLSIPGDARIRLEDGTASVQAEHRVAGVAPMTLALTARVDGGELARSPVSGSIRVDATRLPALVDTLNTVGVADVPRDLLTAGTVEATADVSGSLSAPRLRFRAATTDPAAVSGATGHMKADGEYDAGRGTYTVAGTVDEWRVAPQPDRPLTAAVNGRFAIQGRGAQMSGDGDFTAREVAWNEIVVGDIESHVMLANDVAHVHARVPDFDLTADGDIRTMAPYSSTMTASTTRLDLSRALRDLALPQPITGTVGARLEAEGPLQQWRAGKARLEVSALDAHAADLTLRLREPLRARYEDERAHVDRLEASVSAESDGSASTLVSVSGALPISGATQDSLVATVTGDIGAVIGAVRSTRLADLPPLSASGPFVLLARVTGTVPAPVYAVDVELGPATAMMRDDLQPLEALRLRAHLENDLLDLREASAAYAGAILSADGQSPLPLLLGEPSRGAASLHARATGVTPSVVRDFVDPVTLDELAGSLDASLDLTSRSRELADVEGELRLDRFEMSAGGLPVSQRQPTRVRLERGLARIESWEWAGQGGSLSLAGQVRLEDRQAAILASGDLDLRLVGPFVRTAGVTIAGRLQPRLSVTGAIDSPRVDGDATLTGGEVRLRNPRVVLTDVTARAVVSRRSVHLLSMTGLANGGALQASGSVEFPPDSPLAAQLAGSVMAMPIEFPSGLRSEVNAELALTLAGVPTSETRPGDTMVPSGTLSGTVTVVRGAYRDPLPVVAGLLASARARSTTTTDAPSPTLENLALDVRVVTDEDLIVDNNVARLQMGGDLRVIGTAAVPALSGRVDIREGGQLYLGRNVYRLDDPGTINFSNPAVIEPDLNIIAMTRVGGHDIKVTLTGTPDTLVPDLSSDGLGQADVAALLLTGRTLDALPTDQAAVIGAELLSNLSGDVLGFAGRVVGLDVLRLGGVATTAANRDSSDIATQVDPTTRLTFGKSLGRAVEVTLSQSLRDGDAQTWIVDYLPARQLALRFVSNDEDLRSYEFRHDLSFGSPRVTDRRAATRTERPSPPRVAAVAFTGEPGFPEAQLRKELRLTEGDRFDFIAWQTDRDRLQDFYIAHHHVAARVTASRTGDAQTVTLTYAIVAGPETAVVITGAALDAEVIRDIEGAWATSIVDELLLDESREIVRSALGRAGYPRAMVSSTLESVGGVRRLTIAVDMGPKAEPPRETAAEKPSLTIGNVAFVRPPASAATPLAVTGETLRATIGLSPGAAVDASAIEDARQRIQTLYRREGFAAARVTARQDVRSATGTVDVTIEIDEGPRQVVGDVVVEGNRGIDPDVITRTLRLETGQPLRAQDWLDARRRLFDTGLFRRVDVRSEPIDTSDTAARVRVRVVVEEWPALRLRYGFQAAEERPEDSLTGRNIVPGVNADVTRRTLFGRAVTTGAAVEWQRRDRSGRGYVTAPTFFRMPVASSFDVERSRQVFASATLITDRSGVSWEQGSRLARNRLNLSYTYHFERNHTFDTEPSTNPLFPTFDITINIAKLTAAGAWDSRDDAGDSTRGSLLSYSFDYAPASLGSDIRFVRQLAQAYHFRNWRGVVFGSAARMGFVSPLGDQELIPSLRFFSGGARTVRGVAEDGLGPRDFFGDPAGGEALLVLNQEARFPIYRWLRGVGFVDAGNVFPRPGDFGLNHLVGTLGGGLRLVTPVALLRVDYGRQVWPGPRGDSGQWFFGVGQSF
jgi:outer membrane protein assembly factor BamA/autotransporter translocation and assembly factor TamB